MSTATSDSKVPRVEVRGAIRPGYSAVLTPAALEFVADLTRRFRPRLAELLARRIERQARIGAGEKLDFLPETAATRAADWKVAAIPGDLLRRTVEITGPVDRKMVINALNSGADAFMADFEDSNSPTWDNNVQGHVNLMDAIRRTIHFADPATGKEYRLQEKVATLIVRPRGLHLLERHLFVDGLPVPGCVFDFGLYFFHNARALLERGTGPYFYLPKLQSHLEARLWNDIFVRAQEALAIPRGTIRATVLIETLPAAFEMDEILYELREHSAGLNCGRWDYIFSFIKSHRDDPRAVLPDRSQITMEQPFMRAYTQLAVRTCHRRGAHAMGGMAAQIPIKNDPEASRKAIERVRADKLREAIDGHDGTWVAHPGLVAVAREVFEAVMPGPNQLDRAREDVVVTAADLLKLPEGTRTEEGLRLNVRVGVQYLEALEDGRGVDAALLRRITGEEMRRIASEVGPERFAQGRYEEARVLFERLSTADTLQDFLTVPAYEMLDAMEGATQESTS